MADHVILDLMAQPPVMRCEHCGAVEVVRLPLMLKEISARGQRFGNTHRSCRKPVKESA